MSGAEPIAVLPMYDWGTGASESEALWGAVRDNLRDAGLNAPETLDRNIAAPDAWTSPNLVLGQTCGLPYVEGLRDQVSLVGTPDYDIPDCKPGWYNSVLIVRADDARDTLDAFCGSCLAVNGSASQSGCRAIMYLLANNGVKQRFFDKVTTAGSHARSIAMVAAGQADIAAVDHVSWRIAKTGMAESASVRVLMHTEPTPGLPLISAKDSDSGPIAEAVADAISQLAAGANQTLHLKGLWRSKPEDYDVICEQTARSRSITAAHGLN